MVIFPTSESGRMGVFGAGRRIGGIWDCPKAVDNARNSVLGKRSKEEGRFRESKEENDLII